MNRTIWQLVSLRIAEDEQLYRGTPSANCPGIVFLPAGMAIGLSFFSYSWESVTELHLKFLEREAIVKHRRE